MSSLCRRLERLEHAASSEYSPDIIFITSPSSGTLSGYRATFADQSQEFEGVDELTLIQIVTCWVRSISKESVKICGLKSIS